MREANKYDRKCAQTLTRRMNHLRARIANNSNRDLSYDKAELAALEWALRIAAVILCGLDTADSVTRPLLPCKRD